MEKSSVGKSVKKRVKREGGGGGNKTNESEGPTNGGNLFSTLNILLLSIVRFFLTCKGEEFHADTHTDLHTRTVSLLFH